MKTISASTTINLSATPSYLKHIIVFPMRRYIRVCGIYGPLRGNVPVWLPSSSAPAKAPDGQTAASWHDEGY